MYCLINYISQLFFTPKQIVFFFVTTDLQSCIHVYLYDIVVYKLYTSLHVNWQLIVETSVEFENSNEENLSEKRDIASWWHASEKNDLYYFVIILHPGSKKNVYKYWPQYTQPISVDDGYRW